MSLLNEQVFSILLLIVIIKIKFSVMIVIFLQNFVQYYLAEFKILWNYIELCFLEAQEYICILVLSVIIVFYLKFVCSKNHPTA